MTSLLSSLVWRLKPQRGADGNTAGARVMPAGQTDNVVSLQASLAYGMTMDDLLSRAGSQGVALSDPEEWLWQDPRGNELVVGVRRGRVVRWSAQSAQDLKSPGAGSGRPALA